MGTGGTHGSGGEGTQLGAEPGYLFWFSPEWLPHIGMSHVLSGLTCKLTGGPVVEQRLGGCVGLGSQEAWSRVGWGERIDRRQGTSGRMWIRVGADSRLCWGWFLPLESLLGPVRVSAVKVRCGSLYGSWKKGGWRIGSMQGGGGLGSPSCCHLKENEE